MSPGPAPTWRDWLALARPRMLPLLWLAVFFGYMLAHWEDGAALRGLERFGVVLAAWTLLHLGTMWLNAWRDQDAGPVAFGEAAQVPRGAAAAAGLALVACVGVAATAGPWIGASAAGAVGLSVAYSHPRTAWKGHPVAGPAVNMLGYGVLTPFAGLVAGGGGVGPRTLWVGGVLVLAMGGLSFAAQAFQQDEDRARGDRTLVATHGPQAAVRAARLMLDGAAVLALLGAALGWFPAACLVGLPLMALADRHLARWSRLPDGGGPQHARRLVQVLVLMLFVMVGGAIAAHVRGLVQGQPPAGQNTRVVPEHWVRPG